MGDATSFLGRLFPVLDGKYCSVNRNIVRPSFANNFYNDNAIIRGGISTVNLCMCVCDGREKDDFLCWPAKKWCDGSCAPNALPGYFCLAVHSVAFLFCRCWGVQSVGPEQLWCSFGLIWRLFEVSNFRFLCTLTVCDLVCFFRYLFRSERRQSFKVCVHAGRWKIQRAFDTNYRPDLLTLFLPYYVWLLHLL